MKKLLSIILTISIVFSAFGVYALGETGAENDPILISSKWDLLRFADDINGDVTGGEGKYYQLTDDIDLGGMNWSIYIGTDVNPFRGTFDGNGKVISNFRITVEPYVISGDYGEDVYGLFGAMSGDAVVKNLGINNVNLYSSLNTWSEVAGGIVGIMYDNAKIDSCYAKNFALYDSVSPELLGSAPIAGKLDGEGVEVTNCYSTNVSYPSSGADHESGIAGKCERFAKIENCYSTFAIARIYVADESKVINSYYSADAPWPWAAGDGSTKYSGTQISVDALKSSAATLGDAYKDGGIGNGGYPALDWEVFEERVTGTGTEEDPILIYDAEALASLAGYASTEGMFFKLANDIDMAGAIWKTPIGSSENPFKGTFDGDGHIIKNYQFDVNGTSGAMYGIFGVVDGVLKNVGVEDVLAYTSYNNVAWSKSALGGLAGKLTGAAKVDSCYAKNVTVNTKTTKDIPDWLSWAGWMGDQLERAGGLIGETASADVEISNCYSVNFQELNDSASTEGGLIGGLPVGTFKSVTNCYSDTHLTSCDSSDAAKVVNCYAVDTTSWSSFGTRPGTAVTASELSTKAADLGEAFKSNGYGLPALAWETATGGDTVGGGEIVEEALTGSGTKADPYVISTAGNIIAAANVADTDGVYFVLANDINLGGLNLPAVIGTAANPFKGNFNGNGHVIKNFKIEVTQGGEYGIFGGLGGNAVVKYFGVEDVSMILSSNTAWGSKVGGIAAVVTDNVYVSNCYAENVIFSATFVRGSDAEFEHGGGLFGKIDGAGVVIKDCYSKGYQESYASGNRIINNDGGFAGEGIKFKAVENCYSDTLFMRHTAHLNVVNCYEAYQSNEWPDGYDWAAYTSDPAALNYSFSPAFVPVMDGAPELKWTLFDGMYINLVDAEGNVATEDGAYYKVTVDGKSEYIKGNGDVVSFDEGAEVVKVDVETELTQLHQSFYHKVPINPVVDFDMLVTPSICGGVEITYLSDNGYISENGELTDAIPTGFDAVNDVYTARVEVADLAVEKHMYPVIKERAPYEITSLGLVDEKGNAVYGIGNAEKISTIELVKNVDDAAEIFAALYSEGKLTAIKKVAVTDATAYDVDLAVNGADQVKMFVYAKDTLMPLAFTKASYPEAKGQVITLHPMGDSLCESYGAGNERTGWGQVFGDLFTEGTVVIDNSLSRSGMSTLEYVTLGRLNKLQAKLGADEYVLIQLGTNDMWTSTKEQYENYLTQMVSTVRAKGAIPVIIVPPDFSSAATNTLGEDGKYVVNSQLEGYPDVTRAVAKELRVPMVDVNQKTLDYFAEVGLAGVNADGYYLYDAVHFGAAGAKWIAGLVAEGLVELGLPVADYLK